MSRTNAIILASISLLTVGLVSSASAGAVPTPTPAATVTATPSPAPGVQPVLLGSVPGSNWLVRVDPATGFTAVSAVITGAPWNVTEIEFSPDNTTLYAATGGGSSRLLTLDPLTGDVLTSVAHASGALQGLEFDGSGVLLGTFFNSSLVARLMEVNTVTGALTERGSTGLGFPLGGLAFDPDFAFLYAISSSGGLGPTPPRLYSLDPSNGVATLQTVTELPGEASSLEVLPDGRIITACDNGALYEIDPESGHVTEIGPLVTVNKLSGLSMGVLPPPPPCCPGDADNSGGAVNAADFLRVQARFGSFAVAGGDGDADCGGGPVNAADFLAVQAAFGTACP